MRKPVLSAALAAALVVAMGGAASAGEITGNGKATPIHDRAGSICAFSGQNDDPTGGGDPFQDGRVQNWGHVVADAKAFIGDGDNGAGEIARMFQAEGPGTNCRGFASGG